MLSVAVFLRYLVLYRVLCGITEFSDVFMRFSYFFSLISFYIIFCMRYLDIYTWNQLSNSIKTNNNNNKQISIYIVLKKKQLTSKICECILLLCKYCFIR